MSQRQTSTTRSISALLLGAAATLVVMGGHLAGWDRRAELQALDVRFRRFATAPPAEGVVCVDIDDRSLAEAGRWPWPRAKVAGIVEVLHRCGARAVALDIIMPDPQKLRFVSEAADVYGADFSEILCENPPRPVFDDMLLAAVLGGYENTFLPMHVDLHAPVAPAAPEALKDILATRPAASVDRAAAELGKHASSIAEPFARTKARIITRSVNRILSLDPEADFASVFREVLPSLPAHARTEEKDVARRAYLRRRALGAMARFAMTQEQLGEYPAGSGVVVPPLVIFAGAIHQTGFVTVDPDIDGVVRRIPLLVRSRQGVFAQFALAIAAWDLGEKNGGPCRITADRTGVTVEAADGSRRRIPTDADGYMTINWVRPRGKAPAMRHIPAASVELVCRQQNKLRRNKDSLRLRFLKLAEQLGQTDLLELYKRADRLYARTNAAAQKRMEVILFEPGKVPPSLKDLQAEQTAVEAGIDRLCNELLRPENLDFFLGKPAGPAPPAAGPAEVEKRRQEYDQALAAYERERQKLQPALDELDRLARANAEIAVRIDELQAGIRRIVSGKICMIGATFSGAGDFVPTPMSKRTPGVVVHSNILNTIVSGTFVHHAGPAVNILAILLAGVVVSLLTANRPVLQAAPAMLLLAGAYAAFNALVVFGVWNTWLIVVAPLAAMFGSFMVVTAYRELTEERAKRRIRAMFAHALSPALVDRLIEDPSLARLGGERRVLSCFFADLAGFTSRAEKLGEQRTVRLLNRYFDRMTEVVQNRCGGYLNKFLGDGIFVFFGAPVFQDDHAARAIRAAVECQTELEKLNVALTAEMGQEARLSCRVGVATGEVMVGNCGSSSRMDYTAIGDTVNLASRLETANNFFGTRILVADATWRDGRQDSILARPLGRVIVVGKTEAQVIWNVVAPAEEAPAQVKEAMGEFAAGIDLYAERDFAAAAERFRSVLSALPDDRPAEIYLALCEQHLAAPPPEDWDAALRLTEK